MLSMLLVIILLSGAQGMPQAHFDTSATRALAEGLSAEDMMEAFLSRGLADLGIGMESAYSA